MTSNTSAHTPTPGRKKPAKSDVIGTAILAAVGAFALTMGVGYGFLEEDGQVGPGFLPVVTGGFILAASLAEIARLYLAGGERSTGKFLSIAETAEEEARAAVARTQHGEGSKETGEELDTFGRTTSQRSSAIVKIFAILFVAMLLIPVIGLLLSLTAMVLVIMLWVERKPLLPSLLSTAGAFVVAYLIFVVTLGVPVPQGMLGLI